MKKKSADETREKTAGGDIIFNAPVTAANLNVEQQGGVSNLQHSGDVHAVFEAAKREVAKSGVSPQKVEQVSVILGKMEKRCTDGSITRETAVNLCVKKGGSQGE